MLALKLHVKSGDAFQSTLIWLYFNISQKKIDSFYTFELAYFTVYGMTSLIKAVAVYVVKK